MPTKVIIRLSYNSDTKDRLEEIKMAVPDTTIEPRIMKSAKVEFTKCGYKKASLKNICQNAGVTTGALYKRFAGKADLFEKMLEPTVQEIWDLGEQMDKFNWELVHNNQAVLRWNTAERQQLEWTEFMYERYDEMRLLLSRAEGTKYQFFLKSLVEIHVEQTVKIVEAIKRNKQKANNVEEDELYILYTAFWTAFFEPIVQRFSKEKAQKYISTLANVFNWQVFFGY